MSQSIPFALPADVARADGDVLVSSEELSRGGGGIKARPHARHQLSETTHSEPRFRALLLTDDGTQQMELVRA